MQVHRALTVIMGEDGTDTGRRKIAALRNNSNHMRRALVKMGCHVYGDYDSPVIPVMCVFFACLLCLPDCLVCLVCLSVCLSVCRFCLSVSCTDCLSVGLSVCLVLSCPSA
jgi:hypothetical protein